MLRTTCSALVLSLLALAMAGTAGAADPGNTVNDSFRSAKRMLERQVYFDHRITLYCGAKFDAQKNIRLPEGFTTPSHAKRALRVEWEHAVPAENFGRAFVEWREGDPACVNNKGKAFKGRRCAEKVNKRYRYMQADMYNLFPAIGAVNAVRGNKQYSELPHAAPTFGTCPARVDGKRFEPPVRAKGQVARAGLYMAHAYPEYRLSAQQRRLFEAWDRTYPVDAWECTRARRIEQLQGNENPYVKRPCQEQGLW